MAPQTAPTFQPGDDVWITVSGKARSGYVAAVLANGDLAIARLGSTKMLRRSPSAVTARKAN